MSPGGGVRAQVVGPMEPLKAVFMLCLHNCVWCHLLALCLQQPVECVVPPLWCVGGRQYSD